MKIQPCFITAMKRFAAIVLLIVLCGIITAGCQKPAPAGGKTPRIKISRSSGLKGHAGAVVSGAYSNNGKIIATGDRSGRVILWRSKDGKVIRNFHAHPKTVHSIAFSPKGRYLATGSADRSIKVWEVESGRLVSTLKGTLFEVFSVDFSPDGNVLASGAGDDFVRIWDYKRGRQLKILRGHIYAIHTINFSPDGRFLASGCYDDTISLWDGKTFKRLNVLTDHKDQAWSVRFSPDSKLLAAGCEEGAINIWDVTKEGVPRITLIPPGKEKQVTFVRFLNNDLIASTGTGNGKVYVRDVKTGKMIVSFNAEDPIVEMLAVSPDGKEILTGGRDGNVKRWRVSTEGK